MSVNTLAPTSNANSAPVTAIVSRRTSFSRAKLSIRPARAKANRVTPPVAAASTAYRYPSVTAASSPTMNSSVIAAVSQSRRLGARPAGVGEMPVRALRLQVTSAHSRSSTAAGANAPRKTSWVLMIRTALCVTLTASVWARIIASLRRMSTSDGGITTPKVLATATNAAPRPVGTLFASSRGSTVRVSIATPAPTDPFSGASTTLNPNPANAAPAPVRARARSPTRSRMLASGKRLSKAPISTYNGIACSRSFSSNPSRREGSAMSSGQVNAPAARPITQDAAATPISMIHVGNPVVTISSATAASIQTPAVSISPGRGGETRRWWPGGGRAAQALPLPL